MSEGKQQATDSPFTRSTSFRGFADNDITTVVNPLQNISLVIDDEENSILESVGIGNETLSAVQIN